MTRGTLRWFLVPWRDVGLMVIIVTTSAIPAFLFAAGEAWQGAAENRLATPFIDRPVQTAVASEVFFDPDPLAAADAELRQHLSALDGVTDVSRLSFTLPSVAAIDEHAGFTARVVGRDDPSSHVDVIAGSTAGGRVLVSDWIANRFQIELGDTIEIEAVETGDLASNDVVPGGGNTWLAVVGGTYAALWDEDDSPPSGSWSEVPALVPTFLSPLNMPSFALIVADEPDLWASGLSGLASWTISSDTPTDLDGFRIRRDEYLALETAIVSDPDLVPLLDAIARPVSGAPALSTNYYEIVEELEAAVRLLNKPLRASMSLGLALGLTATIGTGFAFAERRSRDLRLLTAEGVRWPGLAARAAGQLAAPMGAGAAAGIVGGLFVAWALGPSTTLEASSVEPQRATLLLLTAIGLSSITVGMRGQHSFDREEEPAPNRSHEIAVLGLFSVAAAGLWFELGSSSGQASDLTAVLSPLVTLIAVVGLVLLVADLVLRRATRVAARLSPIPFLALRRATTDRGALRAAASAVGMGVGLVVYASLAAGAVDRATEARASTTVGAPARLDLFGAVPEDLTLPTGATQIWVQDTRLTPGGRRIRVVAIDNETFAEAAAWPADFGVSSDQVVAMLEAGDHGVINALGVQGEQIPDKGGFGARTTHSFTVVGRVASLPLAGEFGDTLLVSARRLNEVAAARTAALHPTDTPGQGLATSIFRSHVLFNDAPVELIEQLTTAGVGVRESHTTTAEMSRPNAVAIDSSLGYQLLLGVVAAGMAAIGIVMMIGAQRTRRRDAHVVIAAMGMPTRRLAMVTALEVGTAVAVATSAGVVTSIVVADRLFPHIDPSPTVPPSISVAASPLLGAVILGVIVGATILAWIADLALGRFATTLDSDDR